MSGHREVVGRVENVNQCEIDGRQHELMDIMTGASMIPLVSRCQVCGWIDTTALDASGESLLLRSTSERAARMAVTIESEPFAFTQQFGEELPLREILYQALGAASMCWVGGTGALEFDSTRAKAIGQALEREVDRALKDWSDLAYELYALACNSSPNTGYPDDKKAEWQAAFERLRDRFHELLPGVMDRLKAEAELAG